MSVLHLPIMPYKTHQRVLNEMPKEIPRPMYSKMSWLVMDSQYTDFLTNWRRTSSTVIVLDFDTSQSCDFSLEDAYYIALAYAPCTLMISHFINNARETMEEFSKLATLKASIGSLSAVQFIPYLESSNCDEAIRALSIYKNFRGIISCVSLPDHVEWPVPYMEVSNTSYTESRLRCLKRWSLFQQVCNGAQIGFHLSGLYDPFEITLYRGSQIFSCSSDIAYACAVEFIKFGENGLEEDRPIGNYYFMDQELDDARFEIFKHNLQWLDVYSPTTKGACDD